MKILLSTFAFQGAKPEKAFLFTRKVGLDGVELVPMPSHVVIGAKKIKELSRKYNSPVLSVHQPPWHWPHATKGMIKNAAKFSKFLGAQNLTLHLSLLRWQNSEKIFNYIMGLEKEIGITISMENNRPTGKGLEFPKKWAWEPEALDDLIRSHNFKITLDNAHLIESGGDPVVFFKKHKDRIRNVHIHNLNRNGDHAPFSGESSDEKALLLLDVLKEEAYDKLLTLEIFPRQSLGRKLSYDELETELKRSVDIIRKRLGISV